jgi:pimeloyl-ACP methyl ester carboxylesterase
VLAWEESGSGPPVVLVHGLTEDRRSWDAVVPRLDDRFRCVRLDLRGHGASIDADDYSAVAMAEDVAAVVAEAEVDEPPLLVGHSLGAVVVTAYATQAPARGVINVDQPLRFADFARAIQPMAPALRGPDFGATIAAIIGSLGTGPVAGEQLAYLTEKHAAARQDVVVGVWSLILDSPPGELAALADAMLGAVRAPYLAIHGEDPGADYRDWLGTRLPTATVEVWPGNGHYPHLAEPDRFAARVADFHAATASSSPTR